MTDISTDLLNAENLATEGAQVPEWIARPFQLVSLEDMLRVYAEHYIEIGSAMERLQSIVAQLTQSSVDEESRIWIAEQLGKLKRHTLHLHLDVSTELIGLLIPKFQQSPLSGTETSFELNNLMRTIKIQLRKQVFLYIPPEDAVYYDVPKRLQFNFQVRDNFPSLHADVREAYACIVFGLYTASVFHSMRVVEKGLNALATALSVSFAYEQWHTVIKQIESKVKDLENLPKGQQKSEDQQFYSEAAKEFYYFKDAWRNHVMHGRATYNKPDAERILDHVRQFMGHLASRLKE